MCIRDRRITAKHIRELDAAGIKQVAVPDDFLIGRVVAEEIVDQNLSLIHI